MIAIFGVFGILLISCILEVYFGVATIQRARDGLDRLFIGKGHLRFFGVTALFAVALYAVGTALMAPFIGVYNGAIEVGTLCLIGLFGGMIMCWSSAARDVVSIAVGTQKPRPDTSIFFSTVFVTAFWGCAILLTFYDHSVTGPLIGVSVNL